MNSGLRESSETGRESERDVAEEKGARGEKERERERYIYRVRPNERRRAGRETTIDKEGEQHRNTET